jgi:hypothetical protein
MCRYKGEIPMSNSLLDRGAASLVRRNHALEHATLQVLAAKIPGLRLAGYSDPGGFWVVGQVNTEDLQLAVDEALARLAAGEHNLAIHPNCGTNFAVPGMLAGTAAWLAMLGSGKGLRAKLDRLPFVISLVTTVLILSHPLGPIVQAKITTDANPRQLRISEIRYFERTRLPTHRVRTYDAG